MVISSGFAGGDGNGGANVHGDFLVIERRYVICGELARAFRRLPHSICSGNQGRQMNRDFEKLAARAAPAIFVVLWSTGFIGTKYVLRNAEPLTYLAIRMALVVALMAIIAAIARPRWPDRIGIAPQHRRRHSGARLLSRRHRGRDRAFDSRRTLGADPGPAADPDLDPGEPLARRTRDAAAMGAGCCSGSPAWC